MNHTTVSNGARLHVLTAEARDFEKVYLVHKLAANWESMGFQMSCGPLAEVPADVSAVLCHWDQTKVDPALLPSNPHSIPILNSGVLDISKDSFSTLIVSEDDAWKGPVIVKTNFNCYGQSEWKKQRPSFIPRLRKKLSKRYWRLARRLPPKEYPVLDDLCEVPAWVWGDSNLIVEKFLPERDGSLYGIRFWVFFGKKSYSYQLFSDTPIVKNRESAVRFEFLEDEPPEELIRLREARGLDFGKIDYVVNEGQVIAFDINKTPAVASSADAPHLQKLAEGIFDFVV
jgi:hypothetical protein